MNSDTAPLIYVFDVYEMLALHLHLQRAGPGACPGAKVEAGFFDQLFLAGPVGWALNLPA